MSASSDLVSALERLKVKETTNEDDSNLVKESSSVGGATESTSSTTSTTTSNSRPQSTSRIISIDAEALASGKSHLYTDRAPCWVGLVNDTSVGAEPLLDLKMRPPVIIDYLSELSGVDENSLRHAPTLADGLKRVHALLGPDVTIVGWNVQGDIDWLQLRKGVHYKEAIDCIGWFTHMQRRRDGKQFLRRYGLAHVSRVLLGQEVRSTGSVHSPVNDALATLRLYEKYQHLRGTSSMSQAIDRVRNTPIAYTHARVNRPTSTGVCMSGYDERECICGKPSLRED